MKRTRSLVVVDAWRTRRETVYAMMSTERAARRETTVVWSITSVEGDCVSILAICWCGRNLASFQYTTVLEVSFIARDQYFAVKAS